MSARSVIVFAAWMAAGWFGGITASSAAEPRSEADYRDLLCMGMKMEVRLEQQSIADCISDTHAIEVEWADNWKEGVGQSLTYSHQTSLIPGIILICRKSQAHCLASSLYVQETFGAYGIEATVWECSKADRELATCLERWVCRDASC